MHGVLWIRVIIEWRHKANDAYHAIAERMLFRSHEIDRLSYLQDTVFEALISRQGLV
jgi:hypothetical protein